MLGADQPLIYVQDLTKRYGRFTAIRDVSFSVRSCEILGLIGPNGAGKTTLFECLAGIQHADAGTFSFVEAQPRSSLLFYIPDGIAPWPKQSVGWALKFALGFFNGRRDLYGEVVHDLQLDGFFNTAIGALSKGQRKRFLLAVGLLARQPVIAIDEPFDGLDLRQSRELEATLRKHVAAGRTLFVSIHQIADAARICDRFVLLSNGKVCGEGTLDELSALARAKGTAASTLEEVFLALT